MRGGCTAGSVSAQDYFLYKAPHDDMLDDVHECRGFESHLRQLIFSRKSDCLGCAVLLCLVCLFDLACFFLSSFSSLI